MLLAHGWAVLQSSRENMLVLKQSIGGNTSPIQPIKTSMAWVDRKVSFMLVSLLKSLVD